VEYADLARPLYQLLKEAQQNSQSYLEGDPESKNSQTGTPISLALSLPTQDCFQLYVYEKGGLALGILTQL
jgi:hypothetical protein